VTYPGGKAGAGVYQTIINQMPPHRVYIEAFLGAGAVMRFKRPATSSIAIDADDDVINQWQRENYYNVPNLKLLWGDGLDLLRHYDWQGDELVYCDPPYLMETRSNGRAYYRFEFTDKQHQQLLEIVKRIPAPVILSGYYSAMYAEALSDWCTITFQSRTRGGRMATEWLWMNYPEPLELHDYHYLGGTFRERERIKRKRNRWKAKLLRMPALERHAILSAIQELRSPASSEMAVAARAATPDMTLGAPIAEIGDAGSHLARMGVVFEA